MADYEATYGSPEQGDPYYVAKKQRKSAAGRTLVRWNPDMDQLVLLCVDSVCTKLGMPIPWTEVAEEVKPGLSGEAIKQHLAKVYKYRAEHGHQVPERVDRAERRKVTVVAARGRDKKQEEKKRDASPKTVKPGSSLLFTKATPKKKAGKKATATPKTPATGRGSKAGVRVGDGDTTGHRVKVKIEPEVESDVEVPEAPRGNKRSRKPRAKEIDELMYDSPSKRPKTGTYLRAKTPVNYNEQLDDEDAASQTHVEERGPYEDDEEEEEEVNNGSAKNEAGSSQGSIYDMPPPHFDAHAQPSYYHDHSTPITPAYEYGTAQANPVLTRNSFPGFHIYAPDQSLGLTAQTPRSVYGANFPAQLPYTAQSNTQYGEHVGSNAFSNGASEGVKTMQMMHNSGGYGFGGTGNGPYAMHEPAHFTPINAPSNHVRKIENDPTDIPRLNVGHNTVDRANYHDDSIVHPSHFEEAMQGPPHINTHFENHGNLTISPTDLSRSDATHVANTGITPAFDDFAFPGQRHHHGSFDSSYSSGDRVTLGLGLDEELYHH